MSCISLDGAVYAYTELSNFYEQAQIRHEVVVPTGEQLENKNCEAHRRRLALLIVRERELDVVERRVKETEVAYDLERYDA
jgi:hypothetical protein